MIIFDLKCEPQGHVFEGWFASTKAYETQLGQGLLTCPLCGSAAVAKAPMAPALSSCRNPPVESTSSACGEASGTPDEVKAMLAAAAAVQQRLLEGSESVGDRFADEARAIHLGETPARPIHGRATRADAEGLIDEGVPIAPLPFPVIDPGERN